MPFTTYSDINLKISQHLCDNRLWAPHSLSFNLKIFRERLFKRLILNCIDTLDQKKKKHKIFIINELCYQNNAYVWTSNHFFLFSHTHRFEFMVTWYLYSGKSKRNLSIFDLHRWPDYGEYSRSPMGNPFKTTSNFCRSWWGHTNWFQIISRCRNGRAKTELTVNIEK